MPRAKAQRTTDLCVVRMQIQDDIFEREGPQSEVMPAFRKWLDEQIARRTVVTKIVNKAGARRK